MIYVKFPLSFHHSTHQLSHTPHSLSPMNYEPTIIRILYMAGAQGISVHKLSLHVHNASNDFFTRIPFEEVRQGVQAWLLRHSRGLSPDVIRVRHGYYSLNKSSARVRRILENGTQRVFDVNKGKDNATLKELELPFDM